MTNIEQNTRYYAHAKRADWTAEERVDFTETVFYATAQKAENGQVSGKFELSDLITEFRITANAFTKKGVFGYNKEQF